MTMPLGSQTITLGKTGYFDAPTTGIKGLIIGNESPTTLSVVVGPGLRKTLYPETVDYFPIHADFNGNVTYFPSGVLTNPSSYTASTITFDAVGINENIDTSVYPLALTRPAVSTTATGKPIFTCTAAFFAATTGQVLNIFNPANSGRIGTFHSITAYTSDTANPECDLIYFFGADNNLAIAKNAVSHSGQSSPPVSVMHCTAVDSGTGLSVTSLLDAKNIAANVDKEFLSFPDNTTLAPGGNLYLSFVSVTSGKLVRLTLKWTEDTIIPPLAIGGPGAVASSIRNDGNPVGTSIIEATPQGAPQAVQLFNDGTGFYAVDQSGVAHRVFTFNSSGNPLQQGQAGDVMEFLGQLTVDQILNVTGASNLTGLLTAVAATFTGQMQINQAPTVVNGSVGGTATFYVPIWGTSLKVCIVTLNGWNSASVATFTFPSGITFGWYFGSYGSAIANSWGLFIGGAAQNTRHMLTLGAANAAGTDESINNPKSDNTGAFALTGGAATSMQVGTTGGAANTGVILIVGV